MLLISLLVACNPETIKQGRPEEGGWSQLGAQSVDPGDCTEDCFNQDLPGPWSIESAGDAWVLSQDATTLEVLPAGGSDLSAIDGASASVRMEWDDWTGLVALGIRDAEGVGFAVEPGAGDMIVDELFGRTIARYGAELGVERDGDYDLHHAAVIFSTDDGDIEVKPGVPTILVLDGLDYRAVVTTAYTTELAPGAEAMDCGGRMDMLAYELVRMPTPEEEEALIRPDNVSMASVSSCG